MRPSRLAMARVSGVLYPHAARKSRTSSRSGWVVTCWSVSSRSSTNQSRGRRPRTFVPPNQGAKVLALVCPRFLPLDAGEADAPVVEDAPGELAFLGGDENGFARCRNDRMQLRQGAVRDVRLQPAPRVSRDPATRHLVQHSRKGLDERRCMEPGRGGDEFLPNPDPISRDSSSRRPPVMARSRSGISQPVVITGRSRAKTVNRVSLGHCASGQTRAYVRRLASKYSRMPSQRTPSKSRASTSGTGATELTGDEDFILAPTDPVGVFGSSSGGNHDRRLGRLVLGFGRVGRHRLSVDGTWPRGPRDPQLPHPVDQRTAVQSERRGGAVRAADHPAHRLERLEDQSTFGFFQSRRWSDVLRSAGKWWPSAGNR